MKKSFWVLLSIFIGGSLLLVASWQVNGFADIYVKYIYPVFLETYGRLTGLVGFSVGEIMLYLFAGYIAITVFILLLRFITFLCKKEMFKELNRLNLMVCVWLLAIAFAIQTLNCFIMYHTTPLYGNEEPFKASYTELFELREQLVIKANALAETFERDERGNIVYSGDIKADAVKAMQHIGEVAKAGRGDSKGLSPLINVTSDGGETIDNGGMLEYYDDSLKSEALVIFGGNNAELLAPFSRLTGYYSRPKPFFKSDFFSQQYMKGYFFPFSLEANYNNLMNVANFPDTFCHELAHLKGFILEDEASFVSYLACINSGNSFIEYSGILNAIAYINYECVNELTITPDIASLLTITPRSKLVEHDMSFVSEEDWQKIEEDAIVSTEVVKEASDRFLDTNLVVNGVSDGVNSYSRLVNLILQYYLDK